VTPPRQRVYDRAVLIGHDAVSGIAWDNALKEGLSVGICPRCHHPLAPGQPHEIGRAVWYPATCRAANCTYETTAHGPRPPKKTAAKGDA
jgi:hypothetical protein